MSVQHSRFDVVPTPIRGMADRRIMFHVESKDAARVALGFRPDRAQMPVRPGQFLLKEPGKAGVLQGQSMLVEVPEEIHATVLGNIEDHLTDPKVRLFHDLTARLQPGATLPGTVKTSKSRDDWTQNEVLVAKRHFAHAGALTPPSRRGEGYILAAPYDEGLEMVERYILEGRWTKAPDAFVEN
jgi:hypothetical protein